MITSDKYLCVIRMTKKVDGIKQEKNIFCHVVHLFVLTESSVVNAHSFIPF